MRRIAVINQKGGVGKTTTTANLGAALARLGHRTVVCDLDPQCNLTVHLDLDPGTVEPSLYDLFHGKAALVDVLLPAGEQEGFWIAPASVDLAGAELELVNAVGREVILREAFEREAWQRETEAEFLLVDCPPSLGLLSLNALVACDELLVPLQTEFFALQGLSKLVEIVQLVQQRLNPALRISAMVSCRHDPSTNLGRAVVADIRAHFGEVLLDTVIRRDVKLAEAPSHGRTIFQYDPETRGAADYLSLARALLGERDDAPAQEAAVEAPPPAVQQVPHATEGDGGASAPVLMPSEPVKPAEADKSAEAARASEASEASEAAKAAKAAKAATTAEPTKPKAPATVAKRRAPKRKRAQAATRASKAKPAEARPPESEAPDAQPAELRNADPESRATGSDEPGQDTPHTRAP